MPRLRLSRSSRLKSRADFDRTRARGRRVVKGCLIANAYPKTEGAPSRLGVITNRKVGPAVGRARARRLLRETYRLHQRDLTCQVDLVLVARPSIVGKTFADVERDFMSALKQMRLINVPPASGSAQAE